MTDRINSLTIVLDRDMREDDCESLIAAIYHFKGVIKVSANISDMTTFMAQERAKQSLRKKLDELIEEL